MTTLRSLQNAVREAWASVPAPPAEDLKYMDWGWGEEAAEAFTGVAPMDVNISSAGFQAADPLLNLPPRAAAAYLGTYLRSMLWNLEFQKKVGLFDDIITRAHTLTCLSFPPFWQRIKPFLSPKCREVLARVTLHVASEREAFAITPEDIETMQTLATDYLKSV